MNDDEFDLRLRQAVRPLVTEIVPRSVAQDMDAATWRRTAFGAGVPAVIAIVIVIALAGAFPLSKGGGLIGPGTFPSPAVDTVAAHGTKIATPDGTVFARTSPDGAHLELVLQKDAATSVVLVSINERIPANSSFGSVHLVDCPPSTGLLQRYYVLGQDTNSGKVVLHGLAGTAAKMAGGRYLIAITSASIPPDRWTFDIGGQVSGGAIGSSFLNLPAYGQRSAAGCFFNAP